jgi:Ca2+-binding RTX toxin-like protein
VAVYGAEWRGKAGKADRDVGQQDTVYGLAGRDWIDGCIGDDELYGGRGRDHVYGANDRNSVEKEDTVGCELT